MHFHTPNPNKVRMARAKWKAAKSAKKKAETFVEYQTQFAWYMHCLSTKRDYDATK